LVWANALVARSIALVASRKGFGMLVSPGWMARC
jgi:hypothetical protein